MATSFIKVFPTQTSNRSWLGHRTFMHAAPAPGKLQSTMAENTIDFAGVLRAMQKVKYSGYVVLEYVWVEWMDLNRVDNLSETIILRDLLRKHALPL